MRFAKVKKVPLGAKVEIRLDIKKVDINFYQIGDLVAEIKDKNQPQNHNLDNLVVYRVIKD